MTPDTDTDADASTDSPTQVELWSCSQQDLINQTEWDDRDWKLHAVWRNGTVVRGEWEGAENKAAEDLLADYDGPTVFAFTSADAPGDAEQAEIMR